MFKKFGLMFNNKPKGTFIALDIETTGFEPNDNSRIVEIATCSFSFTDYKRGSILFFPFLSKHYYINPNISVGTSEAITGISDDMLIDKPLFIEIAEEFIGLIKDETLLLYDAAFDLSFLNYELELAGFDIRVEDICNVVDCREMAKKCFLKENGHMHNLDYLEKFAQPFITGKLTPDESIKFYKSSKTNRDAYTIAELYLSMLFVYDD